MDGSGDFRFLFGLYGDTYGDVEDYIGYRGLYMV